MAGLLVYGAVLIRQDQPGAAGEGLLRGLRPRHQGMDDEAGAVKPPLYHRARCTAGGEVSNSIPIFANAPTPSVATL